MQRPLLHVSPILLAAVLYVSAPSAVLAVTPEEYRRSVESARVIVVDLLNEVAEAEAGAPDKLAEIRSTVLLQNILPKAVRIETADGVVETSNEWMHLRLEEFQKEPNHLARTEILEGIEERLAAISFKIGELEAAERIESSKDEEKRKLAEILRREEYQQPVPQESRFEKWITQLMEWFRGLFPQQAPVAPGTSGMASLAYVLQILLILAVTGLIVFGLYKLLPALFPSLRRRKRERREERVILGERIGADETAGDLFAEAENIARMGDLRGAIRKGYIALLCELNDRRLIGLARHKTNRDYLRDVRLRPELHQRVSGLTNTFERNWYGSRATDPKEWEDFRARYREAVGQAGRG
jgi:hypothetical protein